MSKRPATTLLLTSRRQKRLVAALAEALRKNKGTKRSPDQKLLGERGAEKSSLTVAKEIVAAFTEDWRVDLQARVDYVASVDTPRLASDLARQRSRANREMSEIYAAIETVGKLIRSRSASGGDGMQLGIAYRALRRDADDIADASPRAVNSAWWTDQGRLVKVARRGSPGEPYRNVLLRAAILWWMDRGYRTSGATGSAFVVFVQTLCGFVSEKPSIKTIKAALRQVRSSAAGTTASGVVNAPPQGS